VVAYVAPRLSNVGRRVFITRRSRSENRAPVSEHHGEDHGCRGGQGHRHLYSMPSARTAAGKPGGMELLGRGRSLTRTPSRPVESKCRSKGFSSPSWPSSCAVLAGNANEDGSCTHERPTVGSTSLAATPCKAPRQDAAQGQRQELIAALRLADCWTTSSTCSSSLLARAMTAMAAPDRK